MKATGKPQPVHTADMVGPTHAALAGPLADLVELLQSATRAVRSIEAHVTDSAADGSVAMIDLAGVIHAANQLSRAAAGIEVGASAGFARRDEIQDPARFGVEPTMTIRATGFVHEGTSGEIANLLGISDAAAWTRADRAVELASRMPRTLRAVTAGAIELWQAHHILDECRLLTDDEARDVDEYLEPRLGTLEPTRLRAVTKYAVGRVDPDKVRQRATKSVRDRTLEISPAHEPGLSHVYALVPSHQAAAIWEAADTLGAQYRELDPTLTADQARADAFVDLVLSDVHVSAQVTLGMPIVTSAASAVGEAHETAEGCTSRTDPAADKPREDLTDEDLDRMFGPEPVPREPSQPIPPFEPIERDVIGPDPDYDGPGIAPERIPDWMLDETNGVGPGCQVSGTGPLAGAFTTGVDLPRFGHIPADVIAGLLGHLDISIARALIDARNGTVLETVTDAYKPTRRIRDFVTVRDGTCRMYGCTRPAAACDQDHALAHDKGGPTSPGNLAGLCRFHHRAKQASHWSYDLDRVTGVATWVCRRTGSIRQTSPRTALAAQEHHLRSTAPPELPALAVPIGRPDPGPPPF